MALLFAFCVLNAGFSIRWKMTQDDSKINMHHSLAGEIVCLFLSLTLNSIYSCFMSTCGYFLTTLLPAAFI